MTEIKANKLYNETSKIIENKFKEIDLMKFLFEGNRISIKKSSFGKGFYHTNDGNYDNVFNDDYHYILQYGIINDTNPYENCKEYYSSKEEWNKVYNNGFNVELYSLHVPHVGFQINFGKKYYNGLNDICRFIIENNIPFEKLEIDKELEIKLNKEYKEKQVFIKEFDLYGNIENVYKINDKIMFGVEAWEGSFLIDIDKTELVKDKKDLEYYEDSLEDSFDFK